LQDSPEHDRLFLDRCPRRRWRPVGGERDPPHHSACRRDDSQPRRQSTCTVDAQLRPDTAGARSEAQSSNPLPVIQKKRKGSPGV